MHLEPYEKWQRTRAIVEADFEYLRGLGVGRVYIYYPFDGLIPDAEWLELSAQFPSIELYAQTSDAVRAAQAGFDGVYTYDVYAVRGGAFAGFCKRATRAGIACAAVGRAGLQRNSRHAGPPRAQPPGRRHVRRHVAGGDRRRPRPNHDHQLQRVARGHSDRASPATGADDLRRGRELRGSARPQGQGGERAYLIARRTGRRRTASRLPSSARGARWAFSALDHPERHEAGDATGEPGPLDDAHHSVDVLVGEGRLLGKTLGRGAADDDALLLELAAQLAPPIRLRAAVR